MLSRNEIQTALGASRVVPLNVTNPHGPLGLEHLASAVEQVVNSRSAALNRIQRSISLPLETWQKLDDLAHKLTHDSAQPISASDIATSLVVKGIETVSQASL